jgi:hypothetical protein
LLLLQVSIVGIQSEVTERTIPESVTDPESIAQIKAAFDIVDEANRHAAAASKVAKAEGGALGEGEGDEKDEKVTGARGTKRGLGSVAKNSKKSAPRASKRTASKKRTEVNEQLNDRNLLSTDNGRPPSLVGQVGSSDDQSLMHMASFYGTSDLSDPDPNDPYAYPSSLNV